MAIGDAHLKNAAVSALHAAFANLENIGDHGSWLANRNLRDGRECATGGLPAWKMSEQIGNGLETQVLCKRLGRAVAEHTVKGLQRKQHLTIFAD